MQQIMKHAVLILAALAGVVMPSFAEDLAYTIIPTKSEYLQGEPVLLDVYITNLTSSVRSVHLGWSAVENTLFGLSPTNLVRNTLMRRGGIVGLSDADIAPGQRYSHTIVQDEWLQLPVGTHTVASVINDRGRQLRTSFVLNIRPSTPETLKARLQEILDKSQKRGALVGPYPAALRATYRRGGLGNQLLLANTNICDNLRRFFEHDPTD
jgi:hypothetical protein